MMIEPGTKVLITKDVRGVTPNATGQIGTYEGDFPISVTMCIDGKIVEFQYGAFMELNPLLRYPTPSIQDAIASGDTKWKDKPYYLVHDNPRILLPDGSRIWGYECWWGVAEGAPDLAEAQAQTEDVIGLIHAILEKAEAEDAND